VREYRSPTDEEGIGHYQAHPTAIGDLDMSYAVKQPEAWEGKAVGSGQCVAYVHRGWSTAN
jgi:hypothetical protein